MTRQKNNISIWYGLGSVILFLILSGTIIALLAAHTEHTVRQRLLSQAKTAAAALDIDDILQLSGTRQDLNKTAYLHIKEQLKRLRLATKECRFLYLMGQKKDGQIFFYVHSQPSTSEDYAQPGLIYEEVDPGYLPAFKGISATVGPVSDRWGTLVSALVPIRNPQDRQILAVLGMDVSAGKWKWIITRHILGPAAAIVFLGLLLSLVFTNRKRLEKRIQEQTKELRESREELKTILHSIGDGVLVTDTAGKIVEINHTAANLTGWDPAEAKGRDLEEVFRIVNTFNRTPCSNPVQKVLNTGQIVGLANHTSLLAKDGREYQVADSAAPIVSPKGKTWGVVLTFRDVSAEYRQQRELAEMAEKYQSIFINAPIGILLYDSRGVITECNPFFAYGIGVKPEALIGLNMPTQLKNQKIIQEIKASLTGGRGYYEGPYPSVLTGKTSYVRGFFKGIYDKNRQITGGIGILEDITERKQAEQELRKTKELLHQIINSMPQILICVDPKGKIILFNRQAEQEYALTGQQINRPFVQVLPQLQGAWDMIQEGLKTGQVIHQNKVAGEPGKFFDLTVYPLLGKENIGLVLLIEDISRQVQMEELMIQSEKMLSVGGLAAGMAHEINNPLAGIIQSAEIIQRRISTELPANIQAAQKVGLSLESLHDYFTERKLIKMLQNIKEAGFRAAEIVRNMLNFARKDGAEFTEQDIDVLLDRTIELACTDYDLKKRFDFKQIRIIRDYAQNLPKIPCTASSIQQVFFNILKNGAEAMHESRKQTGHPDQPTFWLRIYPMDRYICIEIKDNGPGMADETRKRIFEPFFTTKGVGQGTGLGLSVAYFIVTVNHQGTMSVDSHPGKGTTFYIKLPQTYEQKT